MKIKYLFYGLAGILLLLSLVILLPIDDELDAEAAAWGQAANDTQDVEGNGYYYLMGIMAAPAEDPAAAGKALLDNYRATELKFLNGELAEFVPPDYPSGRSLPAPGGDYYCRIQDAGCYSRLASNPAALREELRTHAVLLERYRRYLQFEAVKFLVEPVIYEKFPPYQYIARGNKLNQFRILVEAADGDPARALSRLHEDMAQLRRHLADASSLIGKMMMLAMLADDLDLLFNLSQAPDASHPVPALTQQERSLQSAMAREFGYVPNLFRQMKQHPDSLEGDFHSYDWLVSMTIKPNMSINELFPYYKSVAELSAADAAEFNRVMTAGGPRSDTEFSLRNIGGYVLNSIGAPELTEYIARIHNVDCKIALVNAALTMDNTAWTEILNGARQLDADNPYQPGEKPYADREAQALCFNGPLPDGQKRRCIRKDVPL